MISAEDFAKRAIDLFNDYRESFGLADADFPDTLPQCQACEYEDKFCALMCEHLGHDIGPDQCGKPEHDYCYRCSKMKVEIEGDGCCETVHHCGGET